MSYMDTSCYFACFFTLENSSIIFGAGFLSLLLLVLYKKSKCYTLRLITLYLILAILPFTTIFLALTTSCSHGFCIGDVFELIFLGIVSTVIILSVIYYFFGARICLKAMGGKFLQEENRVKELFHNLCTTMDVKAKLAYLDSGKPLAMSISGSQNLVIVSIGALEVLHENELNTVIAHELAHLKLRDPFQKFISHFFGFLYPYHFIAHKLELEQEKRANEIAQKFSSPLALKGAISKFRINKK